MLSCQRRSCARLLSPSLIPPQELRALPQGSAPNLSGKDWGSFGFDLSFSPLWHHPELCFPAGEQEGQPPLPPKPPPTLIPLCSSRWICF